jgi:hypothetical protein
MKVTGEKVGSWSLPAGTSCPASSDAEVCKTCYAKKGMYRFPTTKNVRDYNRNDYHNDDWVSRMIKAVNKFTLFRWLDSGDIENAELATKIYSVIQGTPKVRHWVPTRTDKIPEIAAELKKIATLPNVAVRYSADNIGLVKERPNVVSYVIKTEDLPAAKAANIHICPATSIPGRKSCDSCTLCYTNAKVAYLIH